MRERHREQFHHLRARLKSLETEASIASAEVKELRRKQQAMLQGKRYAEAFEHMKVIKKAEKDAMRKHREEQRETNERSVAHLLETQAAERAAFATEWDGTPWGGGGGGGGGEGTTITIPPGTIASRGHHHPAAEDGVPAGLGLRPPEPPPTFPTPADYFYAPESEARGAFDEAAAGGPPRSASASDAAGDARARAGGPAAAFRGEATSRGATTGAGNPYGVGGGHPYYGAGGGHPYYGVGGGHPYYGAGGVDPYGV